MNLIPSFFLGLIIGILIIAARIASASQQRKIARQSQFAYQESLFRLSEDPSNVAQHKSTLAAGRAYANYQRNQTGETVFDEIAVMNDMRAACANANGDAQPKASPSPPAIEQRLMTLNDLLSKQLIRQDEFDRKRDELLSSL